METFSKFMQILISLAKSSEMVSCVCRGTRWGIALSNWTECSCLYEPQLLQLTICDNSIFREQILSLWHVGEKLWKDHFPSQVRLRRESSRNKCVSSEKRQPGKTFQNNSIRQRFPLSHLRWRTPGRGGKITKYISLKQNCKRQWRYSPKKN